MAVYDVHGTDLLDTVNDVTGAIAVEAYDLEGSQLFESFSVNEDSSTGTSTGYELSSSLTSNDYVLRLLVNFTPVSDTLQSFCYDYDNELYYKFNASTTVKVYDANMDNTDTITMPLSAGHNNDACYYNGNIYFPNNDASTLYIWKLSNNTVDTAAISGISQPANGSTRGIDAICETSRNSGEFYLIGRDVYTNELVHQSDDKLSVYIYDVSTGVATLLAEYPWDCVYVQGAAVLDGILYVACNTQTTGSASNYTGITVKAIRTDTWAYIDTLVCSGNFEPEGMDVTPAGEGFELMMGIGKYNQISMDTRFTAPYSLEEAE